MGGWAARSRVACGAVRFVCLQRQECDSHVLALPLEACAYVASQRTGRQALVPDGQSGMSRDPCELRAVSRPICAAVVVDSMHSAHHMHHAQHTERAACKSESGGSCVGCVVVSLAWEWRPKTPRKE